MVNLFFPAITLLTLKLTFSASAQTFVTDKPGVTTEMSIKKTNSQKKNESLNLASDGSNSFERFEKAKKMFARLPSDKTEVFLSALAENFSKSFSDPPWPRFQFYVANTLNASIWPFGSGFFVVHAGLLRYIDDLDLFSFFITLEMAHSALEHQPPERAADKIPLVSGIWPKNTPAAWPVEFWATLVKHDPISAPYTTQQESDALELVFRFFKTMRLDFSKARAKTISALKRLDEIPNASSLPLLHRNLSTAIHLPFRQLTPLKLNEFDFRVTHSALEAAREDLRKSTIQFYPWLLEVAPYRDVVRLKDFERAFEKRKTVTQEGLNFALGSMYFRGLLLLREEKFESALSNAQDALKLSPTAEPFLWQKTLALEQLEDFSRCIQGKKTPWGAFDHRRRLLEIECTFLAGHLTEARSLAEKYATEFEYDIEGRFWSILTEVKLRRDASVKLFKAEAYFGDRPAIRALKAIDLGERLRTLEAASQFDFISTIEYSDEELGIFDFAHDWYLRSFASMKETDTHQALRARARSRWRLARLMQTRFPEKTIENR